MEYDINIFEKQKFLGGGRYRDGNESYDSPMTRTTLSLITKVFHFRSL